MNDQSAPVAATPNYGAGVVSANIRQFSFVVGDPEQEEAFAEEIREARKVKPSMGKYPTMLAFHGEFGRFFVGSVLMYRIWSGEVA